MTAPPLKAALVYDAVYPYTLGGVEHRNHTLARLWASRVAVTFLGFEYWSADAGKTLPECRYVAIGPARPLHNADGKRRLTDALAAAVGTARALWQSDADVWEVSNIPYFPVIAARLVALLRRRPLIVTWYEYFGDHWETYLGSRAKGRLARWVEWVTLRCTPRAIVISPLTRDRMVAAGFPAGRVTLIPAGVDADGIAALEPDPDRPADLVYAGRLTPHKRVDLALRAFARLRTRHPGLTFRVIGDGPARAGLEKLADDLGVAEGVTFDGFLPDEADVFRRIKAARVAVLPSEREGFGLVLAQAWACGLPGVVCRGPENAMATLVTDPLLGRVTDPDPESVATGCEELLTDPDRRADRTAYARDRYDLKRVADLVAEELESVTQRGRG
jgi:glycosyltransferase involved in cell wall biosynthesis